ncbi:WecB/TagA/CpsF family glycosyltransferase [Desulfogranum mediterraneum]|uniref:WecB/TagA/CpsF family glycosyltransferase n=1 Tax=Desulfogranum mediterraneum TaxID=160661 RepID=UPI000A04031E|nr:WecB/TagA/CpsF family glycosyltransferase [Desulfogranum mediterraneum]
MPLPPDDPIHRDLQRDAYCLLGLPVDNLTLAATKALVRERAKQGGTTVLATINVNWLVQSFKDPHFRAAILNSDIVTLDGRPLLWLTRLLGCPMRETVPGSTLIQELQEEEHEQPLSLFLFGGEEGAAEQAMQQVNQHQGGLKAVGALNPGFGTVEEMSSEEIIQAINRANPDILLVALGAKKGTLWIERNRHRLNARVISHLGATINFLAGTVQRAPGFIQEIGMEWLWRILQEPKLFRRYASDGLALVQLLMSRFPLWLQFLAWQKQLSHEKCTSIVGQEETPDTLTLSFGRNIQLTKDASILDTVRSTVALKKDIILDFRDTHYADNAFMGLLTLVIKNQKQSGKALDCINIRGRLKKLISLNAIQTDIRAAKNIQ